MGHRELASDIDGLEVVVVQRGVKPRLLPPSQISELRDISSRIHNSLTEQLLCNFPLQPQRAE